MWILRYFKNNMSLALLLNYSVHWQWLDTQNSVSAIALLYGNNNDAESLDLAILKNVCFLIWNFLVYKY